MVEIDFDRLESDNVLTSLLVALLTVASINASFKLTLHIEIELNDTSDINVVDASTNTLWTSCFHVILLRRHISVGSTFRVTKKYGWCL